MSRVPAAHLSPLSTTRRLITQLAYLRGKLIPAPTDPAPSDLRNPYELGIGVGTILRLDPLYGWVNDEYINTIRIVVQAGFLYRASNLDDEPECDASLLLARRVRNRRQRLYQLAGARNWGPNADIDREMAEIRALLSLYHQMVPIDVDGVVAKVVRAIGPNWRLTNPNKPTPRIRHAAVPHTYQDFMSVRDADQTPLGNVPQGRSAQ